MMHSSLANLQELPIVTEAGAARAERSDADALLVVRLRAGDVDAFELLVERYQLPLFRFCVGWWAAPNRPKTCCKKPSCAPSGQSAASMTRACYAAGSIALHTIWRCRHCAAAD